jgi:dipeptidyl aminopeptidase/acylaminoacyl peptidase
MVVFQKSDNSGGSGGDPWEIWAVNSDGSGDTNLTNHPSDNMGPSWSPDGSEITFTSTRDATEEDPFRADIYVMAAPTTLPPPTGETASVTTRACYELGRKSHRNADSTVGLVPSRSPFPAFLSHL